MDRHRLISSIAVLYILLLTLYPWQTIAFSVIIAVMYFVIKNINPDADTSTSSAHRRAALREAKIYLSPYSDIWRSLKLSNLNCSLRLGVDGTTITGRDSHNPGRRFKIIRSKVHPMNYLWDMFCSSFNHKTTYERLIELCAIFQAEIRLDGEETQKQKQPAQASTAKTESSVSEIKIDIQDESLNHMNKDKLDVNNASEMELTALPGISIVLAKKIIKKRDELGGFKDVNTFLGYTGLKPRMRLQLKDLICINKMKGSGKIKRNAERSIDL